MRERNRLADQTEGVKRLEQDVADSLELIELGEAEGDQPTIEAAMADLRRCAEEAKRREIDSLLSGEADQNDAYIEVNAGAGGTDAQDWAEMLVRMYMRWAEARGFKVVLTEQSEGDEAGIKSATLQVTGESAYGWAKTETGVHRLVRISPFGGNDKRQTSFASVYVYPVIDDKIEIEVNPADLKTDTFRASAPAASTSTRRSRACASPTCRRASSPPRRRTVRSTATASSRWICSRLASTSWSCASARRSTPRSRPARPTSAGATRSAPTSCSPTRW
jgi:protein subunit release factor A